MLGHVPHSTAHARAEPNRAELGFGWREFTTCGYECNSVQGVIGPATFWKLFIVYQG